MRRSNCMSNRNSHILSSRFFSGVLKEIPANMTCADIQSFEYEDYYRRLCICEQEKELANSSEISMVVQSVEKHLNSMITHKNSSCCLPIRLESPRSKLISKVRDLETITYMGIFKVRKYTYKGVEVLFDLVVKFTPNKGKLF